MKKAFFSIVLMFIVLSIPFRIFPEVVSYEKEEVKPLVAPINPEFLKYEEDIKKGIYPTLSEDGHPLGYRPSPVDISHMKGIADKSVVKGYASSYDLRTQNKLTAIRNQHQCGACWSFAAMASLESYLKPGTTWDFSEQHLNANHGFDHDECAGGNGWMSAAYFLRWSGPVKESEVPYPYDIHPNQYSRGYSPQKHVQQVIFLPTRSSYTDNDTVKYFITTYGAVQASYDSQDANYNLSYNSYYHNTSTSTNHVITIVGWDDNYSASKFVTTPPGNGAFIARNSWGSSWGENGYFYISYYDTSLGYFISFNSAESTSNYEDVYEYDYLGWTNSIGYSSTTGWGANIFTARSNFSIKAVGFYLNDVDSSYQIYVYKGVSGGNPKSGTLSATASGSKSYSGFYTQTLSTPVSVSRDERFSVVVKYMNKSYNYPITFEGQSSNYSSAASASSGESYISSNGTSWTDITSSGANRNVCIKAYVDSSSSGGAPQISLSQTKLNFTHVINSGTTTGNQTVRISNSGSGTLNWSFKKSDTSWLGGWASSGTLTVSVSPSGLSAGTYTGSYIISDTNASNSPQTITVTLKVISSSQTQSPFGDFATPVSGTTYRGSVPVTGWTLDDVQVMNVKIYNGNSYIGDAVFIEGARPDVQVAYPDYPFANKAGWGYMLLTYFLPNGGNGSYTLVAKATDKDGHTVTLGSKTITCDNAHATKPFGAIDTPAQGGTADGSSYVNFGWVLTPLPRTIPVSGSTIFVNVDGVNVGNPIYNQYREDIASLFPNYNNSGGAVGAYYLNTTSLADGIHTIQWIATDNGGNSDGIGSRYFTVQNTGSDLALSQSDECPQLSGSPIHYSSLSEVLNIRVNTDEPISYVKGYSAVPKTIICGADKRGVAHVFIHEDELVKISLKGDKEESSDGLYSGYQIIGNELKRLPIGSTLDSKNGIFYWMPSAGFYGDYEFLFLLSDSKGAISQKRVHVKINPHSLKDTFREIISER